MHQPLDLPIMVLNVFIDTEFTDFVNPQLISIALVAETGEEFYAELPFDIRRCSDFVRETVVPLLGYSPEAELSLDALYGRITQWLVLVRPTGEEIQLCYDFQTDWDLFSRALEDRVPFWVKGRLVADRINELLRHEFHAKNRLPEHHALNDARGNCYAFRELPPQSAASHA